MDRCLNSDKRKDWCGSGPGIERVLEVDGVQDVTAEFDAS
jgi:hypothetical protein